MSKKETAFMYEMCQRQFDEMRQFYLDIGYSEKQADKLCSSCFGTDIVVGEHSAYQNDWTFGRRFKPRPEKKKGLFGFGKNSSAYDGMVCESARSMSAPMMGMAAPMAGMPAPLMKMAPMPMSEPALCEEAYCDGTAAESDDQWNTAETHSADEVEEESTLDRPQIIFSANVNTASWSYLRNKIVDGDRVDKDFVRIEEIINSYKYKMKTPKDGSLFSVYTEHAGCPWNKDNELFMVGLRGKKVDKDVSQNLAFLVDVSGSMEDNWILVQMSLASIMSKLKKGDHMSVISYSDKTETVAEKMKCGDFDDYVKVILAIDGIGGCTRGSKGLEKAYSYISDNFDKDANNRVFIFTDGDFNFGITSEKGLSDFIYEKRKTGIYLSIVGYGFGNFKDNKMEALARNGNGNYTFVSNPADILDYLHDKLVSNLVTVAKDVKISVEINPQYVKKYRLIGYDARLLTKQEFNDTEKAVDGIGSGHNVVALIEFARGHAKQQYTSRYTETQTTDKQDEFAFIEIHYKTPEGEDKVMTQIVPASVLEEPEGRNMPVISLLAAFGLAVKDSKYKGSTDKAMLSELFKKAEESCSKKKSDTYSHFSVIKKYIG